MKHWLTIILSLAMVLAASAQKSQVGNVRQQKKEKQEEIERTSSRIDSNKKEITRQLNSLRSIEADITTQGKLIKDLGAQLDSINRQIGIVNDSIAAIDKRLGELRKSYAASVRKLNAHSSSFDRLMFVFSAGSFHEAYRRMRYLRQFKKWRERNTIEINEQMSLLESEKKRLEQLKVQKSSNLTSQQRAKFDLEGQKNKHNEVIGKLRKQDKQLRSTLAEQQRQADALDRELERLIAEEQRRAAEEEKRRQAEERAKAEAEARRQQEAEKQQKEDKAEEVVPPKKDKEEEKEEPQPPRREEQKPEPSKPGKAPTLPAPERTFKGSFESNKGRLLFPVTGKYKIVGTFGQHRHPDLKYVKVNNNGIDIEAQPGAVARAIFDGKVSAVFPQDGYHTVVMVRHGKYLSIYVNLSEIYIRKGDTLKAGQAIGKVYSDPDDGGRTILHFEVRKEKDKLDPQQWVK